MKSSFGGMICWKLCAYKEDINSTGNLVVLCASKNGTKKKKSLLHHYKNPLDIKNDFDLSCCVCMAECNLQLPVFWVRELKVIGARRRGSSGGKEAATWYPTMELPSDKALDGHYALVLFHWFGLGTKCGFCVQLWSTLESEIKAFKRSVG